MPTTAQPSRSPNARPRSSAVASERGFGLIEVMVAALLLAIGLLATVQIVDQANASSAATRAREGSTNVVRQVVEGVNSLPYTSLTPGTIDAQLQAIPGLADASGAAGWQVVQRGVTYTLATTMCTVDDPRDGKGAQDATFCASSGPAGTTDIFPADYQRVTTTVSWRVNSKNYSAQVVAVITPRQTADVPQVTALTSSSASPITSALASVSFTVTTMGNTAGVVWSVDGSQRGLASGSGTSWTFSWPISTLVDGDYVVGARAYDANGRLGRPVSITFRLNRNAPSTPLSFVGGRNGSQVEAEWYAGSERDIVGYHVWRQSMTPAGAVQGPLTCGGTTLPTVLNCIDTSPIADTVATIAYHGNSTATGNPTVTVTKPAAAVAGDVLIATLVARDASTLGAMAGWTPVAPQLTGCSCSNQQVQRSYWRVSAGEASYSFTGTTSTIASVTAYSGVNPTSPIDVTASSVPAAATITAAVPTVTTTAANEWVYVSTGWRYPGSGITFTDSAPLLHPWTGPRVGIAGQSMLAHGADFVQAAAGTTPASTITSTASGSVTVQVLALRPSVTMPAVDYWVTAVDRDAAGALRDGPASNRVSVNVANNAPTTPGAFAGVRNANNSVTLSWTVGSDPDAGDSVAFYRVYRDGVRFDRTGLGTDTTFTDPNVAAGTHTYYLTSVDTHLRESPVTASVTR